ncbi:beta-1,4 N-acetylgalactosaminyltransferase 1-like [Glandiceps talaboti]
MTGNHQNITSRSDVIIMRISWILKSVFRYSIILSLCFWLFKLYARDGQSCNSDTRSPGSNLVQTEGTETREDPFTTCRELFIQWLDQLRSQESKDVETERSYDGCTCHRFGSYGPLARGMLERRRDVLKRERLETEDQTVHCPPMSILSFIGGGIKVEPLADVNLLGLSIHPSASSLLDSGTFYSVCFRSTRLLGSLRVHVMEEFAEKVDIQGQNTDFLTINSSLSVDEMNQLLSNVLYRSNELYIDTRDVIEVSFLNFKVQINLHIVREPFPKLYNMEDGDDVDINRQVTVVTKTFLRYDSVNQLVKSVNRFYPNMTIIVVDDSELVQPITGQNVKHYVMPFKEGWFAGRNLGLSQVSTKYFFYVDDDMVFTENTKLETLLERLEWYPKLDLLGARTEDKKGALDDNIFAPAIYIRNHSDEGYCLYRRHPKHYHNVGDLNMCYYADEIGNIFLGRTASVRKIGFDPMFDRVGHMEFYYDALGVLRVAVCNDVTVFHDRVRTQEYISHRYIDGVGEKVGYKERVFYSLFKNNLKCIGGVKMPVPPKKSPKS